MAVTLMAPFVRMMLGAIGTNANGSPVIATTKSFCGLVLEAAVTPSPGFGALTG